jgi:hypothetical protein
MSDLSENQVNNINESENSEPVSIVNNSA